MSEEQQNENKQIEAEEGNQLNDFVDPPKDEQINVNRAPTEKVLQKKENEPKNERKSTAIPSVCFWLFLIPTLIFTILAPIINTLFVIGVAIGLVGMITCGVIRYQNQEENCKNNLEKVKTHNNYPRKIKAQDPDYNKNIENNELEQNAEEEQQEEEQEQKEQGPENEIKNGKEEQQNEANNNKNSKSLIKEPKFDINKYNEKNNSINIQQY